MPPILSPIESLGLAGAALDGRIRKAGNHISDATFARIADRLNADAIANEVVYERDGKLDAIRVMMRPLVAMNEQLTYVHHVCLQLVEALKRLPTLYLKDAQVRKILAITEGEDRWLRDIWTPAHEKVNPVYGRLDAVCDFTAASWQETLKFMEANLSGVGGIHYGPLAEQLIMRDIVPTIVAHDPALRIELPRDQRDLFIQLMIDHARAIGRAGCRLCFVEPKYAEDGINEQSVLSQYLSAKHGLTITHADPSELRVKGEEVFYEDTCVDVAYRDYETRELLELEEELGKPLDAMRLLFKQNRVVSSIVGDFDHKSCWELLTDPAQAERFYSIEECRMFRRHVLWTRIVSERKTTLPHNVEGDLLEYARTHREFMVLKPNRSYGGDGVMIGPSVTQAEWEKGIDEALTTADDPELSWVVQSITRLPVHEFPVLGANGRVSSEPFYAVMGFAPTENGLGTMCRVSQKQVVNVAQHGGMGALLVAHPPGDLCMPKRSQSRTDGVQKALRKKIADLQHLDNAIGVLEWDEETTMPSGGAEGRGEQLATLEGLRHNFLTSDALGDLIEEVQAECESDERWCRELTILRDLRQGEIGLDEDLVRRFSIAKSNSLAAWEEAREKNDYAIFAPLFDETLKLLRETAQAITTGEDLYDVLMDEYEPSMTRSRLEPVLAEVRTRLVPLVKQAAERGEAQSPLAGRKFAEEGQWALAREVLSAIGFDFERGRVDRATHPGTMAVGFDDVRIALRTDEDNLASMVLTTLHEGGHGLYDQGFADGDRDSLLANGPSMALHESQARLWENHIGRNAGFWHFAFPKIRAIFGDAVKGLDAGAFHHAVNRVRPSLIRASSDELSYHLHIVLRYELEVAMLSGALTVKDLPGAWNERSKALLGLTPATPREGVLQDGHWASGMFGYFPTYTLGSLYAAQMVETYERTHSLSEEIARGNFAGLLGWLRKNIHEPGDRLPAEDIVTRATGKGLDASAYFRHIEAKLR